MTENDMILVADEAYTVLPVSPQDVKAWERVQTVLSWMEENQNYCYRDAFAAVGIPHATFYRDMKNDHVQLCLLEMMHRQNVAAMQLLEASWLNILRYQAHLAAGLEGSPREATAAARFIAEHRRDLNELLERTQGDVEGQSEASVILQRFKQRFGDGRPVTARRTTVTEEVEVG